MSITRTVLLKSLLVPFYKQNAALFAFLLFIMVAAVGRANDAGLLEYHFSLIKGILTNFQFLLFSLCAWFLYALKCSQFIVSKLRQPDYVFISLISLEKAATVFIHLLFMQMMILLPVLAYAAITVGIGLRHHWYTHAMVNALFFLCILFFSALRYQYILRYPYRQRLSAFGDLLSLSKFSFYWLFLIRYIWTSRKTLFIAIKTASCLILFGLISGPSGDRSGLQMIILFYSFGLLGHGVLIYKMRSMEEKDLSFYRGMAVILFHRFKQYALLYFLVFVPEIVLIAGLTPLHISYYNAILLIIFGYSVLLFLNSILFIRFFRKTDYLKIVTGLFLLIFIVVLTGIFPAFCIGLLSLSVGIFFFGYYQFEHAE